MVGKNQISEQFWGNVVMENVDFIYPAIVNTEYM